MKRLKILFAACLLALALPFWRYIDAIVILSPFEMPVGFSLIMWFAIFILIPLKLIIARFKTWMLFIALGAFGAISLSLSSYSHMATTNPEFGHCGPLTYTGVVYHVRKVLTDAHRDDLEVRNQMCWLRKLISRVPEKFDNPGEMEMFSKLTRDKLIKPEIKYRASLPLIALLNIKISSAASEFLGPKEVYDSLRFWEAHYTDEIQQRKYPQWNWPHSEYIKWEYGLIEDNWQSLIDSIVIDS